MAELFKNKYRVKSARHPNWDYGSNAIYFVTVCTYNRFPFLGKIVDQKMQLTEIGKMAQSFWFEIPGHFSFVELDEFVVMPDHIHGILIINKTNDFGKSIDEINGETIIDTGHCPVSHHPVAKTNPESNNNHPIISTIPMTPAQKRFRNQGKNTLSSIFGSYKSVVSKNAHFIDKDFAWQGRFYDKIIKDAESYKRIKKYIKENPTKWNNDNRKDKI